MTGLKSVGLWTRVHIVHFACGQVQVTTTLWLRQFGKNIGKVNKSCFVLEILPSALSCLNRF